MNPSGVASAVLWPTGSRSCSNTRQPRRARRCGGAGGNCVQLVPLSTLVCRRADPRQGATGRGESQAASVSFFDEYERPGLCSAVLVSVGRLQFDSGHAQSGISGTGGPGTPPLPTRAKARKVVLPPARKPELHCIMCYQNERLPVPGPKACRQRSLVVVCRSSRRAAARCARVRPERCQGSHWATRTLAAQA